MSKRSGLHAKLRAAIEASYADAERPAPTLAHVACYRGHLVAKVIGEGGCDGYNWILPYKSAAPQNDHLMFRAESFDEAFDDIDELIGSLRADGSEFDPYDPREDIGQV